MLETVSHKISIINVFSHAPNILNNNHIKTTEQKNSLTHIYRYIEHSTSHFIHNSIHPKNKYLSKNKNKSSSLLSQYCILCNTHQLFYSWCRSIQFYIVVQCTQYYNPGHRVYQYVAVNWKHRKITQHQIHNYHLDAPQVHHRQPHTMPKYTIIQHRVTAWIHRSYGAKRVRIISICIPHRCHRWMHPIYHRIVIRLVQRLHWVHVHRPINGVPYPKRNPLRPVKNPINTKCRRITIIYHCCQIVKINQSKYSKIPMRMSIWKRWANDYRMIPMTVVTIECHMVSTIDVSIDHLKHHPEIWFWMHVSRVMVPCICDDQHRI